MNVLTNAIKGAPAVNWPDSAPGLFARMKSAESQAELTRALQAISVRKAEALEDGLSHSRSKFANDQAVVVFFEVDVPADRDIDNLRLFKYSPEGKAAHVVVISRDLPADAIVRLLRAGAEEFLTQPISPMELAEVLLRIKSRASRPEGKTTLDGRIITFAHASGGSGATTLAVNTATLLAGTGTSDCTAALLDFDLQFGAVADHLDLTRHSPVSDISAAPGRLDGEMLENMMVTASSGVRVLTAPRLPLPYDALSETTVRDVLALARHRYRYVVLDLPQTLTPWTDEVLRRSDIVFFVLELNVATVRQARRFLDLLAHEGLVDLPLKLVANRVTGKRPMGEHISIAKIEQALGRKIDFMIPDDHPLVSASINQGRPAALLNRKGRYVQAVCAMLAQACGAELQPGGGIFRKLFGGGHVQELSR